MKILLSAFLISLAMVLTSCAKDTPDTSDSDYYYPPLTGASWESSEPSALGWDLQKLNEAIDFVADNNSSAFIILYKGRIVVEKYWMGFNTRSSARIFSATKSIAAFLAGLASEQGKLDIDKPVSFYIGAGWSQASPAQESIITVRHLLSMTSGLTEDLRYQVAPGTRWSYNTPAYHRIFEVLASAYGKPNTDYTKEQLWNKIGMQDASWDTEPGGGPTMSCSGRDMARFGLMILSGGSWNGTAVMNDGNYFTSMINSSQSLNPSYGYLWWLNGKGSYTLPTGARVTGSLMPNAPNDLVAALGAGDKKIYVVKSRDLVVIRHGAASNYPVELAMSSFDNELWKRLSLAIGKP